ncbi:hypothetical protein Syun_019655 [Stephania yunnanensis]|uniref:Uncharacterized protein n=1 Tax=Stephania yunnanensis TaxID=152371 RepID=A0AAP0IUK1_9MAGN
MFHQLEHHNHSIKKAIQNNLTFNDILKNSSLLILQFQGSQTNFKRSEIENIGLCATNGLHEGKNLLRA